jgi:two-component system, OmpR family, phosphate regulon sensor histidine kinase PhoR
LLSSGKKLTEKDVAGKENAKRKANLSNQHNRSDWIAETSHELRLPVANIRLLMETLLNGALEDEEVARKMVSTAYTEVIRLQSLVSNLLSLEQLSKGRYELPRQWQSLEDRVKNALLSVSSLAADAGISIKLFIEPDFRVYANAAQLDQVLLNLLENAVKYTPTGGTVSVVSGDRDGCFSINDTGIGMPASEIPKIFQRFYRIDRSRNKGSTGLGLSIVKHILDSHGAKITVKSKEGQGSSFLLEFPGSVE